IYAINKSCESLKEKGAKMTVVLPVGGAFHSPLMEPAGEELAAAIEKTIFNEPLCPIYQNVTAKAVHNATDIKKNLIAQLTAPVRWTQSIQQMITDGATEFTEVGPGKVLQGLMRKIDRSVTSNGATFNLEP
ncbi:MAG: ACP S-malonyltransferase, partial [Aureibaculum sp.]